MMTRAEEFEVVRREMDESRARIRQRELAKPLQQSIEELLGDRQWRLAERQEAARRAWGTPSGASFSNGTAGLPGSRNARIVR